MSKWNMVKLSDIFTLQMGKTPSRNNSTFWNGSYKWVSIADLGKSQKYIHDTKERITNSAISESGIKITPKDTIVMSFKLSIGKVAITSEDIYTNEAIMSFIDRKLYKFDIDYIYHLFNEKDWSNEANKAVMGITLNKAILSQIVIPLPPLEIQHQIASNLDKVTHTIDLCNQIIEKLDLLVKARFVEMFGDIKLNSMHYDTIQLDKIANVGSSKRVFVEELQENGIPFYRGTEVGALAEGKDIAPELFITEEHYKTLKKATGVPKIGDLLMPSICSDGRIWIVDTKEPFYFKDGRVLWIHPTTNNINSVYLLYFLKQKIAVDYNTIASGTTFAELKIFALKGLQVFMPTKDLQEQFADFVEQTNKSKSAVKQVLEKTKMLKKALMQEYFG